MQFKEGKTPYIEKDRRDILNHELRNEFKDSTSSLPFSFLPSDVMTLRRHSR
jgi:hypothetical protein